MNVKDSDRLARPDLLVSGSLHAHAQQHLTCTCHTHVFVPMLFFVLFHVHATFHFLKLRGGLSASTQLEPVAALLYSK